VLPRFNELDCRAQPGLPASQLPSNDLADSPRFLPELLETEVEIVRIIMPGTTLYDVTSVRARQDWGGKILFRIVDEYESVFSTTLSDADQPLTCGELIELLDSIRVEQSTVVERSWVTGEPGRTYVDWLRTQGDPVNVWHEITVESPLYPDLQRIVDERAEALAQALLIEQETAEAAEATERRRAQEERTSKLAKYAADIERITATWSCLHRPQSHWADRAEYEVRQFVEEYVLQHGEFPSGAHRLTVRTSFNRSESFRLNFDELEQP
jgi:hypothetical protein